MFMLDEIVKNKVQEVEEKKRLFRLEELKSKLASARAPRDFYSAMKQPGISLIAEVKRKSPSKGELRENFNPLELARIYSQNGARAISVLADVKFSAGALILWSLLRMILILISQLCIRSLSSIRTKFMKRVLLGLMRY